MIRWGTEYWWEQANYRFASVRNRGSIFLSRRGYKFQRKWQKSQAAVNIWPFEDFGLESFLSKLGCSADMPRGNKHEGLG